VLREEGAVEASLHGHPHWTQPDDLLAGAGGYEEHEEGDERDQDGDGSGCATGGRSGAIPDRWPRTDSPN
jgi:hypothetical protein